jgi:hypothetical protein
MNNVKQAVEAIRKSPGCALMAEDEAVTVEALQRDIDALDAELDAIEDDLELAKLDGDDALTVRIEADLAALYPTYTECCAQLELLQAAIAADSNSIH